jgi:hypothetical protein
VLRQIAVVELKTVRRGILDYARQDVGGNISDAHIWEKALRWLNKVTFVMPSFEWIWSHR